MVLEAYADGNMGASRAAGRRCLARLGDRLEGRRFATWPESTRIHQTQRLLEWDVLAGGHRERLLMSPRPRVHWLRYRPIRHLPYPHAETFPGAAHYPTLSSAMISRAIMPGVWQQSKAAPLQARRILRRGLSCSDLGQRAL